MMNKKPVCNFNCICSNADCNYRHYLSFKERKVVGKIYNNYLVILKQMKEEKSESRKANCLYGQMCRNKDCNFKHHINYDGRMMLIERYTDSNKKVEVKEEKPTKVIIINKSNFKSPNLFDSLEEEKEEEVVSVKVPGVVVIKKEENKTKWSDIVKNGEQIILERKKDEFEKMMTSEKSDWADYDDE